MDASLRKKKRQAHSLPILLFFAGDREDPLVDGHFQREDERDLPSHGRLTLESGRREASPRHPQNPQLGRVPRAQDEARGGSADAEGL